MMIPFFLSLFLGSVLLSGDPGAAAPADQAAETAVEKTEPAGIATVVEIKGEAHAVSKSTGAERSLKDGDAIYLDETITTSAGASLQMEVADESLFTIAENTAIRMDLFDLDEEKQDGHLVADVAKGVFRFVSGKVAKVKPENVEINVPSGTIGIRGTVVLGEIEGEKCLVSLEAEEGDKVQHRIVVSNDAGGQIQQVEITKPGFATVIEGRQSAPKPIFALPQENRARFQQRLPAPKFLPRDAQGRPQMNPDVRDPKKFSGPMQKRNEQNKLGGLNPPNGPGGRGPGNHENGLRQEGMKRQGFQPPQPDGFQRPPGFGSLKPAFGTPAPQGRGPGNEGSRPSSPRNPPPSSRKR